MPATWENLPPELKDVIVDWAAVLEHREVYDGRKRRWTTHPTLRSLFLLERATSDRAASHLWKVGSSPSCGVHIC